MPAHDLRPRLPSTSLAMDTRTDRQTRHTPCENCRFQRRKCIVPVGMQCERCRRMDLVCMFKFSRRVKASFGSHTSGTVEKAPNKSKRISMTRKQMLADRVEQLEQLVVATEADLRLLCNTGPTPLFTIRSRNQRLRLETAPIRSVSDVISLYQHAAGFLFPIMRTPRYFSDRTQGVLHITQQLSPVEQTLRRFFARDALVLPSPPTSPIQLADDMPAVTQLKQRVLAAYFSCACYIRPVLVRPYFLPLLLDSPHSMLANAVVALVALGLCTHSLVADLPLSRHALGLACMDKAYTQLRDALFEEPTLETLATLRYLAGCHLLLLRSDDARTLTSLAWRMAVQLKDTFLGPLRRMADSSVGGGGGDDDIIWARAETWRRLFYDIRYIELNLCMLYEAEADFSSLALGAKHIGCPVTLAIEQADPLLSRNVDIYSYLIALSLLPGGSSSTEWTTREEIVGYRLYAGAIGEVSCADIEHIEGRLIEFWTSLPQDYVLASAPLMEVLDMGRVRACTSPSVLFLNEMYYLYWILLEMRFMAPPRTADLSTTSLGRHDGERALLIVSVCCDALVKVTLALYEMVPCTLDIHWVVVVADLLVKLKDVADDAVRARAEQNLQWTLGILGNFSMPFEQQQQQQQPPPLEPAAFYSEITRLVSVYFQTK